MFLKNTIIYTTTKPEFDLSANPHAKLAEQAFKPCGQQQTASIGWVPPKPGINNLAIEIDNFAVLMMKRQERLLPSRVIDREVFEITQNIEADEGRKVSRKERLEIKEKTTAEMLPKAFLDERLVPVIFDNTSKVLFVGTSSTTRADEATELLRTSLKELPVVPAARDMDFEAIMTGWFLNPANLPFGIELSDKFELRQPIEGEPTLKIKNWSAGDEHFNQYIADGFCVTKTTICFNDQLELALDAAGKLSNIKYADELIEKSYDLNPDADKAVQFEADIRIGMTALSKLVELISLGK